jgi:hypothetical protein
VRQKLELRKLIFIAGLACFLVSAAPVRAQEAQPSLADAARQARKDKDKNAPPAKTVITEDNLSAGASAVTSKSGVEAASGAPMRSGGSASLEEAFARLETTEASLDRLEPMSKSELATTVLHGNSADFPNRSDWEDQLFAAKGVYVQRSRQLIAATKQLLANMEALQTEGQGKITPADPRVQSLTRKAQQLMQLASRTESAFQSVVTEGQNLALQAPPR